MNSVQKFMQFPVHKVGFGAKAGTLDLIVPLVRSEFHARWLGYTTALVFMGIAAGSTAAATYLAGQAINYGHINRSFHAVALVSLAVMVIFIVRGFAVYGQARNDG